MQHNLLDLSQFTLILFEHLRIDVCYTIEKQEDILFPSLSLSEKQFIIIFFPMI